MSYEPSASEQAAIAGESIAQMFTSVRAEMTNIEVILWLRQIDRLGGARVMAFVEFWMSGGAQGSYRRVPTIEDLLSYADGEYVSAAQSLELLRQHVSSCGPWSNPDIKDAKLIEAISYLGGWAKVCQDMPDTSDDFAYKRFGERFKAAWSRSEALLVQKFLSPMPLLGLLESPGQLRLEAAPADSALQLLPTP